MKQKFLFITKNNLFIEILQKNLSSDYSITIVTPNVGSTQLKNIVKKRLYEKIIFFTQGERETYKLFKILVEEIPWICDRVLLITGIRDFKKDLANYVTKVSVAFYGDIIAPHPLINSVCNSLLFTAKENKRIVIKSHDQPLYPVCLDDMITAIKTILPYRLDKSPLFIFPQPDITALSFVKIIQKIDPEISFDLQVSKKPENTSLFMPKNGKHMVDFFHFETKLKEVYSQIHIDQQRSSKVVLNNNKKHTRSSPSVFTGITLAFFTAFLLLPIIAVIILFGSVLALKQERYNVAKAFSLFAPHAFFFLAQTTGSTFSVEKFSLGRNAAEGIILWADTMRILPKLFMGNDISKQEFIYGLNLARRVVVLKQYLETNYWFPDSVKKQINVFARGEQLFMAMLDVLPEITGFDGQRTYLVLFQNNTELRPGGGFIGSYGLLTLKSGKAILFAIHDVYDADGQLRWHIEPSAALKKYMGVSHWFLRDSNFEVDFAKNAANAAFFLEKETGQKVDGVIGLDTSFVKKLLSTIGPIEISDFKTTITSENFTLLTEQEIQSHFFPGSRKKKNFLSAVYQQIASAVFENKKLSYLQMANAIIEAVDQKHLLVFSMNPVIQEILTANNISSSLVEKRVAGAHIMQDFIGVNDANIGQNKANSYLTRKIYHQVDLQKNLRSSQIRLIYTNISDSSSLFGGDYKNYLRVILPYDSIITDIVIDGKAIAFVMTDELDNKQKETSDFLEIERTYELGKAIYGMYITVPTLSTRVISIDYMTQQKTDFDTPLTYDLLVFKQPGTEHDPYILTLQYPKDVSVIDTTEEGRKEDGKITFYKELTSDIRFMIGFE